MINEIYSAVTGNAALIGTVLGVILFLVKAVSNKKADPFMKKVQEISDKLPALIDKIGDILKAICSIVSKAIKSDGYLGKE